MFETVPPQNKPNPVIHLIRYKFRRPGFIESSFDFAHCEAGKASMLIGCSTCNPASAHPDLELYPIAAVQ